MTEKQQAALARIMETMQNALATYREALEQETQRNPDGTDPRYIVATGEHRICVDFKQSRERGNYYGYVLNPGVIRIVDVYKFQSQRQAALVASVVKNGHGDRGQVYEYRAMLEWSVAQAEKAIQELPTMVE